MLKKVRIFIMDKGEEHEVLGHDCLTQADADSYEAMIKRFGGEDYKYRITVEDYE